MHKIILLIKRGNDHIFVCVYYNRKGENVNELCDLRDNTKLTDFEPLKWLERR